MLLKSAALLGMLAASFSRIAFASLSYWCETAISIASHLKVLLFLRITLLMRISWSHFQIPGEESQVQFGSEVILGSIKHGQETASKYGFSPSEQGEERR
jgi:hypothetical protein